jgi:RNA polymerase sigma-70 factor (ECF subfamily)
LNPIFGAEKIARFFDGVARKNPALAGADARLAVVNGLAGLVIRETDGSVDTVAFEHREGRIVSIYLVRNPEKLQHVRF